MEGCTFLFPPFTTQRPESNLITIRYKLVYVYSSIVGMRLKDKESVLHDLQLQTGIFFCKRNIIYIYCVTIKGGKKLVRRKTRAQKRTENSKSSTDLAQCQSRSSLKNETPFLSLPKRLSFVSHSSSRASGLVRVKEFRENDNPPFITIVACFFW